MNYLIYLLLFFLSFPGIHSDESKVTCKNSQYILEKSQNLHDPYGNWEGTEFKVHIAEPRLQNTLRYSVVSMNNKTGYFNLAREAEVGEIERIINEEGVPTVLLDGSPKIAEGIKEEYRLNAERNFGYQSFYKMMYGLPMTMNDRMWTNIQEAETTLIEGEEVYLIKVELKEPMISKHWELMINAKNFALKALKFDHSEASGRPDELIIFDGEFSWNQINIPRFRHWYHIEKKEYRGSDVIVRVLTEN